MATLTEEQIQEKKKLLVQKTMEMKALYEELKEAGAIELSDDELDDVTGGGLWDDFKYGITHIPEYMSELGDQFSNFGK